MKYIAPAGTPLNVWQIFRGLSQGLLRHDSRENLASLLAARSARSTMHLVTSGRAGMTLLLQAMQQAADARRNEVIVPGYTCYSVPAAVERAGLRPRLCDIDPHTLSFDLEQLRRTDFSSVLCIVTANLYGIPNDLTALEAFAREKSVFLLDDAAQALGANYHGRAVGSFGDAGLYSFDKGKNITTIQGGAIGVQDGRLTEILEETVHRLPAASASETIACAAKLFIYALMLRPQYYGVTQRLPFLGLGRTPYETKCNTAHFSKTLAGLALQLAKQLDQINAVRIANARRLEDALVGAPGIELVEYPAHALPVFARFPLKICNHVQRDKLICELNAVGIGATGSYPQALADVSEVQRLLLSTESNQTGARSVAQSIVTLPTHAYCPENMATRIRAVISRVLE